MNDKIKQILSDLYAIDGELAQHEKELIAIVEKLLESKPDVKFDDRFVERLKTELLQQAELLEAKKQAKPSSFTIILERMAYVVGGATLCALIIVPAVISYQGGWSSVPGTGSKNLAFNSGVSRLEAGAFGKFSSGDMNNSANNSAANNSLAAGVGNNQAKMAANNSVVTPVAREVKEAAVETRLVAPAPVPAPMVLEDGVEEPVADKMMMPFIEERINYNYVYEGADLPVVEDKMTVYKRNKKSQAANDLGQAISGIDFDLIKMNKFRDIQMTNFSFVEDREFGYSVYFDLQENVISMSSNWMRWPRPDADCRDEKCFESYRLKAEDVPADNEVIAIADKFLSDYGIDVASYGAGEVQNEWRIMYAKEANKEDFYIPESVSVIYPLKVDDKIVFENWGNMDGLVVDVDIRNKKASGVRNIYVHSFQSSDYEAETDNERIMKIAKQGGLYGDYKFEDPTKTIDVRLGEPVLGLVKIWKSDGGYAGEEFYVPAYVFPILNKDDLGYFGRSNITVPVIKEMLDDAQAEQIQPYMPILRSSEEPVILEDVEEAAIINQ